jgi:hypothetical protein
MLQEGGGKRRGWGRLRGEASRMEEGQLQSANEQEDDKLPIVKTTLPINDHRSLNSNT